MVNCDQKLILNDALKPIHHILTQINLLILLKIISEDRKNDLIDLSGENDSCVKKLNILTIDEVHKKTN